MTSKLAITGASGQVGRMIVPYLARAGIGLLLIGRDPVRLKELFPEHVVAGYDELPSALSGCDAVLHLAVLNNDSLASLREMHAVNVDLLLEIAAVARDAGVSTFINATTIHALDPGRTDPYSLTKRRGETGLGSMTGMEVVQLRLPAVYGERFGGRLRWLNRLPPFVRGPASRVVGALRPIVHAERVADGVSTILDDGAAEEIVCADPQEENRVYRFLSRCIDLGFALAVVAFLGWLMVLVWIVVRLTSPGPGLFAQPRVGQEEHIFTCYKFRTMRTGTPQAGTHEVPQSAVTPIGGFLRRSKIDELPQFWNIARGEMSLLGPRPCLPNQTELIEWRRKLKVFHVRPGITGLAQVAGLDMSRPRELAEMDSRYIRTRSLTSDLKIVFGTFFPILKPGGAHGAKAGS